VKCELHLTILQLAKLSESPRTTFYAVQATWLKFRLHADNMEFSTQGKERTGMRIFIIIIIIYLTANGLSPGGSGYNACT
jgi:hypothetical protein